MIKYLFALAAILTPSLAYAEESNFPGSAWVNITGPHTGGEESGNWVITGKINQDAVLTEVSDWKLSAYANVAFSTDTKGFEWNNRITPATGLKLSRDMLGGSFDIGVQYAHETHFGRIYKRDERSQGGVQVTVNYWTGWGR